MFTKILIANRGEIACRVIKTARKMGILTVAVYSDADADSLHVNMADEAIYLGGSPSRESYLLVDKVIEAAKRTGAQAIHPGYGFLSENAEFCRKCEQENIVFIGPPVGAIEAMGSKSAAKTIMEKANVPLVPGYHGDDQSMAVIKKAADDMGYPVLLKATAGGGGKGMRQVWSEEEFKEGFDAAKREALSSFGDDTMLVEKYLTQPRHVEIQVFCDNHGNAVYLFERDCSVQRRHQKVIEEAPAFGMSEELRSQMGESAIRSAQAIGYQGAGTVEFLLDVDGSFYFMEMNTRLQVEHPVTELISGQDLVEWQLRVAAGEVLPKKQNELVINGHAFEARIYAEDANNDFLPATGTLEFLQAPNESENVRVDTGVRQGDEVSVFYDPMIAKLIVWDENREKALKRLTKALAEYRINGVTTNIDFLYNLATCPPFINEDIDTGFIEKNHDLIFHDNDQALADELPMAALAVVLAEAKEGQAKAIAGNDPTSPWNMTNAWRLNEPHVHNISLIHNDIEHNVEVEQKREANRSYYLITIADKTLDCQGRINDDTLHSNINGYQSVATIVQDGPQISLYRQNGVFNFVRVLPDLGDAGEDEGHGGLVAPMNGTMISVLVASGDTVSKDQPLVIMEAMKMEHTIRAPANGKVNAVYYTEGDMVDGGAELLAFEAEEA
jgi:3-methylcrotonyl-CoA carboxylase alpha subunit